MVNKYQLLVESLTEAKSDNWIVLLHRGVTKKFAFEQVNLDTTLNTIEQFAEKLFFYGEKSKYFWNKKIKPAGNKFEFDINDISGDFFEYIFKEFNSLIKSSRHKGTSNYFKKNKKAILFFEKLSNIEIYVHAISQKTEEQKILIRNYYLTILHQLGESNYKQTSQFISSSTDETIADKFSLNEIIINFWELNFNKENVFQPCVDIPVFKGKPYKNQRELSIFTAILPHFIYSFKFDGKTYINPAINNTTDFQWVPLTGLDIKQDNFPERLKTETNYMGGVETNGSKYLEIGKSIVK